MTDGADVYPVEQVLQMIRGMKEEKVAEASDPTDYMTRDLSGLVLSWRDGEPLCVVTTAPDKHDFLIAAWTAAVPMHADGVVVCTESFGVTGRADDDEPQRMAEFWATHSMQELYDAGRAAEFGIKEALTITRAERGGDVHAYTLYYDVTEDGRVTWDEDEPELWEPCSGRVPDALRLMFEPSELTSTYATLLETFELEDGIGPGRARLLIDLGALRALHERLRGRVAFGYAVDPNDAFAVEQVEELGRALGTPLVDTARLWERLTN